MSEFIVNYAESFICSRKQYKEKIKEIFQISGDKPIAIAINGKWGVGKSYFWKNEVTPLLKKEFKKYPIYTSVFGKKDENEIIKDLISQFLTIENKNANTIRDFIQGTLKLFGKNIDMDLLFKLFKKEHMSNTIICIDDFERLSDKISVQDILGLISELKENKECSVVVIFNEDELFKDNESKNKILFDKYMEKVFDFQIQFAPSTIEQFDIFTPKDLDKNFDAYRYFPDVINIDKLLQSHHVINLRELNRVNYTYQILLKKFSLEEDLSEEFKKIYNYLLYPIAYAYYFGLQLQYFTNNDHIVSVANLTSPHASMYNKLLNILLHSLKTEFDLMKKTGFIDRPQIFPDPNGYTYIQKYRLFMKNFVKKIIHDTQLHMQYITALEEKTTPEEASTNFFSKYKNDISSIPYMFGYRILDYTFDDESDFFDDDKKTRSFALDLIIEEQKEEIFSLFDKWCDMAYYSITKNNAYTRQEYFWVNKNTFYVPLEYTFKELKIEMPNNKLIQYFKN